MTKMFKTAVNRSLVLLLSLLLLLSTSGCVSIAVMNSLLNPPAEELPSVPPLEDVPIDARGNFNDLSYKELCDVFFEHEVTWDNLSLNQLVSNPEAMGIEVPRPATLGDYTFSSTKEDNVFYSEIIEALSGGHTIDRAELDDRQKLEAEYIEQVLRRELQLEEFYYYGEPLSPSTGAQASLPLSLMDYSFRTQDDVEIYLEVLADVPRYFEQLIAHEKEKQQQGLLMARESLEATIGEARAYTGNPESHVLVASFNEMIEAEAAGLGGLSAQELADYKERNQKAIAEHVIPAYENLIRELESLVSSCSSGTRLFDYPRGREYYELKMKSMGFTEGAASAAVTLDTRMDEYWAFLMSTSDNVDLAKPIPESVVKEIGENPEDFIAYIQQHSRADFASADSLTYGIRKAPEASPNDYAMAYFLIPPVDDSNKNAIVFFPRNISDEVELYTTMAHEGYPGHMYQFFAYSLEDPSNISKILGATAYIEGWAMYAQGKAMNYLDVDREAIAAYVAYEQLLYALQARIDIGINFEGWDIRDTEQYLTKWGFSSAAQGLYDVSVRQPVSYLPYGLGVIEFDNLRGRAELYQGENFNASAFHQKLTSMGPLPFDMLEREFEYWLISSEAEGA